ncbi:hypothetical protein EVJ58_g11036 [Rhodofomes roseus]|uniref:Uncharacterized protein n=1 Tax=Rhodofomes roseus TaxID=34475 RepID=A0A4Y9XM95_9APHY|nr:hypothetical protein EVJ58_g11036 [Rhodofomes roseus]
MATDEDAVVDKPGSPGPDALPDTDTDHDVEPGAPEPTDDALLADPPPAEVLDTPTDETEGLGGPPVDQAPVAPPDKHDVLSEVLVPRASDVLSGPVAPAPDEMAELPALTLVAAPPEVVDPPGIEWLGVEVEDDADADATLAAEDRVAGALPVPPPVVDALRLVALEPALPEVEEAVTGAEDDTNPVDLERALDLDVEGAELDRDADADATVLDEDRADEDEDDREEPGLPPRTPRETQAHGGRHDEWKVYKEKRAVRRARAPTQRSVIHSPRHEADWDADVDCERVEAEVERPTDVESERLKDSENHAFDDERESDTLRDLESLEALVEPSPLDWGAELLSVLCDCDNGTEGVLTLMLVGTEVPMGKDRDVDCVLPGAGCESPLLCELRVDPKSDVVAELESGVEGGAEADVEGEGEGESDVVAAGEDELAVFESELDEDPCALVVDAPAPAWSCRAMRGCSCGESITLTGRRRTQALISLAFAVWTHAAEAGRGPCAQVRLNASRPSVALMFRARIADLDEHEESISGPPLRQNETHLRRGLGGSARASMVLAIGGRGWLGARVRCGSEGRAGAEASCMHAERVSDTPGAGVGGQGAAEGWV